jgi:DNA-binding NarL/FixJ family response regulator
MHPEEQFAVHALHMGAIGYLSKSAPSSGVLKAVKAAASGTTYLFRNIAARWRAASVPRAIALSMNCFPIASLESCA